MSAPFQLQGFNTTTQLKSGPILVINSRTLYITNLYLDARTLKLNFWIRNGSVPSNTGFPVPDENGSLANLHSYFGENIYIQLQNVTLKNFEFFGVWSVVEKKSYGIVKIPKNLNVTDEVGYEHVSVSNICLKRLGIRYRHGMTE